MAATVVGFAYGSNMNALRLRRRVPSARGIGIGWIAGHRLTWDKRGQDGSGKCDAQHTGRDADIVWGVLFEMDAADKPALDRAEGLHRGYEETFVAVATANGAVTAQMYVATAKDPLVRPFEWYKRYVVTGARQHGLPAAYIAALEAVAAIEDPDRQRSADNTA